MSFGASSDDSSSNGAGGAAGWAGGGGGMGVGAPGGGGGGATPWPLSVVANVGWVLLVLWRCGKRIFLGGEGIAVFLDSGTC